MRKYTIQEILNTAIIRETPCIIVEGEDDVKFYSELSEHINKKTNVLAVENIFGYSEGCFSVIKAIEDLNNINNISQYYQYMLGIVDRDSRYYRNEIPEDLEDLLLILNFYSYESHFISQETIKKAILHITHATPSLLDDYSCVNLIDSKLMGEIDHLYYCSLEALRYACDPTYESVLGYSTAPGAVINNTLLIEKVLAKKHELDEYAHQLGIQKDEINSIKCIAKGKWLVQWFAQNLLNEIKSLTVLCKDNHIQKCQFCDNGKTDKCLYKLSTNYQISHLIDIILRMYDEPSLMYIKNRISMLKARL